MRRSMLILLISIFFSSTLAADIINPQPAKRESAPLHVESGYSSSVTKGPVASVGETRQSIFDIFSNIGGLNRRRCPLCDSSVFPYCGDKLFHDACCCTDPYEYPLPPKCKQVDCAFLHANNCREHRLISNCCCSDEYRSLLRGLGKSVAGEAAEKNQGKD